MGIVEEYLEYTRKWKSEYGDKTLVLMQVGSFFEVYGLKEQDGFIHGCKCKDTKD
jgi:DNA mismatch repair protein MutS